MDVLPADPGERHARRLPGRSTQGRRVRSREVASIDRGVSLTPALWVLAGEMRKFKH
jgi:hypothetical protein